MSHSEHTKLKEFIFLIIIITFSTISVSFGSQVSEDSYGISASGTIIYWPRVDITINVDKIIGVNNLSLGFQLDFEWKRWRDNTVLRQLASEAGFKLIRIFDWRSQNDASPDPCLYWNETTKTGVFDWTDVDLLVTRVFEVGAEPLITLGGYDMQPKYLPNGMATNPVTGLPYPESWAAYCQAWVKHFKEIELPVRFYEIVNEPWEYFGWVNYTRLGFFMELFNAAADAMRSENPNILIGLNGANRKYVLDYWLAHGGVDLDFISFHKYDAGTIGQYDDEVMFSRAETYQIVTSSSYYGVQDVRKVYFSARGKRVLVINSESNFNSAWQTGTDPKIQQMVGAVWLALVLRAEVLEGVDGTVYYTFSSSASWEKANKASGGLGFGMVNSDNNKPWYPYYVQKMIATNLAVGDQLVDVVCSSNDIRSIAWIHNGKLNVLLICKVVDSRAVYLYGVEGQLSFSKVDNTISWETPSIQTGIISSTEPLIVNGYTVILLQMQ